MSDAASVPEPRRAEQRMEELVARGRLRPGRRWRPAGRKRLPRRTDVPTLSATLEQLRADERT